MNDYKELIDNVRICASGDCCGCTLHGNKINCQEVLLESAADAIERLTKEYKELDELNDAVCKEYRKVKKERDAAICEIPHICQTCYGNNMEADCVDNPCWNCKGQNNPEWEWRGVREDDDETD